jgi:dihydroneopterin aldolase
MTIYIEDFSFETIIGILEEERKVPQKVIINCEITYDYKNENFINYALVSELIEKEMKKNKFELIENAVLELISKIKSSFIDITSIKLKISKPKIIDKCVVSVALKKNY